MASPPIPDRPSRSTPTLQKSPAGWEEMVDEDGNIYYVNYFKCITQWENPGKFLMAWNSFPRKIKEVVLFLHIDHAGAHTVATDTAAPAPVAPEPSAGEPEAKAENGSNTNTKNATANSKGGVASSDANSD